MSIRNRRVKSRSRFNSGRMLRYKSGIGLKSIPISRSRFKSRSSSCYRIVSKSGILYMFNSRRKSVY
jgi:hypothetical protein